MAAERRRKSSEAAARLARETGEEEATVREEIRARKEAGEAKRKEDERWVGFCSVNRILSNFIWDCIKVPIAELALRELRKHCFDVA